MGSPEKTIDVELGHGDVSVRVGDKVEEAGHSEAIPLKEEFEVEKESRFTGLKRNELMELANQPKWRRARCLLFVIFWILWVGMLAAAVLIVYNAPKCKPLPETQWYQDTVLYKVNPETFSAEKNYKGMIQQMKYVKNLRTSLLLSNVMGLDMGEPIGDSESFNNLIATAHENNIKVVVELKVDSLSTNSTVFIESSAKTCEDSATTGVCSLFQWNSADDSGAPASADKRDGSHSGYADQALIDYAADYAYDYLTKSLNSWLGRNVDGFLIGDLAHVSAADERARVVATAWDVLSSSSTDEKQLALFVEDRGEVQDSLDLSAIYSKGQNETVGTPAPVVMYSPFSGDSLDANSLKVAVETPRSNSRSFHGLKMEAVVGKHVNQSLALTVVNLALPGVPVLKAGDELGSAEHFSTFTWDKESKAPVAASNDPSKFALKVVQDLIKKRVADTLSKPSLRYDTRDEDTSFFFSDTGNEGVVAFCRKWAIKPAVLVVSNFKKTEQTFSLDYKSCSPELAKAQVLVSTDQDGDFKMGSDVETDKFTTIPGYTTVILIG